MNQIPQVTVRSADFKDIDDIYSLEQACSQNPWSREGLTEELSKPNSIFLVLRSTDGKTVGFACSSIVLDEMQILEVAVHLDYRKMGLGSYLIKRLLSEAAGKNVARACLEVRASNHPAIKLYENNGFKRDGVRNGYYQDGEDAVLMSAEI